MGNPTVSIIIITRNRPFLLRHAIKRVLAQPYPHKELIVIDSSSNNESEQVIAEYPEVLYVRLHGQRHNRPQARNKGFAISSGEIIAIIDDDSMVQPSWLEALVDTYRDETVGAAGGRIIHVPEPYCDQETGSPILAIRSSGRAIIKNIGSVSTDQVEADWLSGCNMSLRRKALEQVGGFDPAYTLTNTREDMDLSFRVKKAGWRVVFNPAIAVVHFSARSTISFQEQPLVQLSIGRNLTYFTIKQFGLNPYTLTCQLFLAPARTCGLAVLRAGLLCVTALAQTVGRLVGLFAGIHWLTSRRRRAESAPKIWQPDQFSAVQPSCSDLNKMDMFHKH